jgi:hypothetical protein
MVVGVILKLVVKMGSKERFVVQLEWTDSWTELSDEEMGILFRNFISYAKGEDLNFTNRIVNVSWKSIQPDIDRMNAKYLSDSENGKKGGAPLGNKNASKQPKDNPNTTQEQPKTTQEQPEIEEEKQPLNNPKTTYKEKDKEKDKENDKDKETLLSGLKEVYEDNIELLNTGEKNETREFYTKHRNEIEYIRTTLGVGLNEAMSIHRENLNSNIFNHL